MRPEEESPARIAYYQVSDECFQHRPPSRPIRSASRGFKQIEDTVLALRGNTPLLVDGRQARNTVALVRAIYESAERGGSR